jgi:P27 family predicted phage terminase small subunit
MKRGRPKKPQNITEGQQPKAIHGDIKAPEYIGPLARAIFERVARTLDEMSILTIGDMDIVASYAETAALGQLHKRLLDQEGATQTSESGYASMSPDYLIWRDCSKASQKLLSDLGLTPASRTRVAAAVAKEVDAYSAYMATRPSGGKDSTTKTK